MSLQQPVKESSFRFPVVTHDDWKGRLLVHLAETPVNDFERFTADIHEKNGNESTPANGALLVLEDSFLASNQAEVVQLFEKLSSSLVRIIVILKTGSREYESTEELTDHIFGIFPEKGNPELLVQLVENALFGLEQSVACNQLEKRLSQTYNDIRSLTRVGKALLTERNFDDLIGLILNEARKMVDSDGGSIYVVEPPETKGERPTWLRFKKSALNLDADEFLLGIDKNSIAGYVALTGEPLLIDDVYKLTGQEDYHFNPDFDKLHHYHTKSMMLIPMKNHHEDVIGVIQLINKKRPGLQRLSLDEMKSGGVIPFTDRCFEITGALAGQAAMAIENYNLVNEIKELFEGFVTASVTAIEQRDPTTSGHSFRVAEYTTGLAECVDLLNDGEYSGIKFTSEQMRELRYASLLHDFGKVGVREKVLVKGKKLYDHELEIIRWRFQYLRKSVENRYWQQKFEALSKNESEKIVKLEQQLEGELKALQNMEDAVLNANEPTVIEEGEFQILEQLTGRQLRLSTGQQVPLLKQDEFLSLSIKKGTLGAQERAEIESHVTHTFNFLSQIPWTRDLENIPNIAHYHHEKLDGSGYPLGIIAEKIPIQTRMMTISDIFDALTAWDRPYKKALPAERAIDILWDEVKLKHVDERLLKVFVESGRFRDVLNSI